MGRENRPERPPGPAIPEIYATWPKLPTCTRPYGAGMQIRIDFEQTAPPEGEVRESSSSRPAVSHPFAGWLELVSVIERLLEQDGSKGDEG